MDGANEGALIVNTALQHPDPHAIMQWWESQSLSAEGTHKPTAENKKTKRVRKMDIIFNFFMKLSLTDGINSVNNFN